MVESRKIQLPKYLKAKEVAETFFDGRIPYNRVLKLTHDGILPATKIGKNYFYSSEALAAWEEKNMNSPAWQKIIL